MEPNSGPGTTKDSGSVAHRLGHLERLPLSTGLVPCRVLELVMFHVSVLDFSDGSRSTLVHFQVFPTTEPCIWEGECPGRVAVVVLILPLLIFGFSDASGGPRCFSISFPMVLW